MIAEGEVFLGLAPTARSPPPPRSQPPRYWLIWRPHTFGAPAENHAQVILAIVQQIVLQIETRNCLFLLRNLTNVVMDATTSVIRMYVSADTYSSPT